MNKVDELNRMPRKKYSYGYALSEYYCKCLCGVKFFGEKRDYQCPACTYHTKKNLKSN